jgi:hypothetical protein
MRSRSVERRIIGFGLIMGSIVGALILSSRAEATTPAPDPKPPVAVAAAQQAQGQIQGQGQSLQSDIVVQPELVGGDSNSDARARADGSSTNVIDASTVYERQVGTLIMGTVIPVDCGFGGQAGGADRNGSGFLGASWTTDRCYTLKVANAWAAMGEYEYACEMLMDVSRRALKRRGIVGVDCAIVGARLRAWHAMPAPTVTTTPVVTRSDAASTAPAGSYVTQEQLQQAVDRAFKRSQSK